MGLEVVAVAGGGGTDWSKYTPLNSHGSIIPANTTDFNTIVNLTGKGYLNAAMLFNGTNICEVKITIDGVLKFWGKSPSTGGSISFCTGLLNPNHFYTPSGASQGVYVNNTATTFSPGTIKSFPYTVGDNAFCLIDNDLFFSQSLLIEAKAGTTALTLGWSIYGGLA